MSSWEYEVMLGKCQAKLGTCHVKLKTRNVKLGPWICQAVLGHIKSSWEQGKWNWGHFKLNKGRNISSQAGNMSEHAGKMLSQGRNMSFNLGTCCVKLFRSVSGSSQVKPLLSASASMFTIKWKSNTNVTWQLVSTVKSLQKDSVSMHWAHATIK